MDNNDLLTRTKDVASGQTVKPYRFCKLDSDGKVRHAVDSASPILGINRTIEDRPNAGGDQKSVEIVMAGMQEVEYGASVTAGDYLTADSQGRAVPAVFTPGSTVFVCGQAHKSGSVGNIKAVEIVKAAVPAASAAIDAGILTVDVSISSAELLALNGTPKTLVAAPGAGKALVHLGTTFYKPAGTAYAGIAAGEDLAIKYTNAAGASVGQVEATGFLDQAGAVHRYLPAGSVELVPVENAALVAHMLTGEITTGTSALKVRLSYKVIDVAF